MTIPEWIWCVKARLDLSDEEAHVVLEEFNRPASTPPFREMRARWRKPPMLQLSNAFDAPKRKKAGTGE